ncbi:MAG: hypothetical protein R3F16_20870 [Myxococcota bacterium]
MTDRASVWVLGADCMTGLQAARLLSRRGYALIGVAADPRSPFCHSRAWSRLVRGPDPAGLETESGARTFTSALEAELRAGPSPAVLLPCTDGHVRALDRERARLSRVAHFMLPPSPVLAQLTDKARSSAHAERCGLDVPATLVLADEEALERACTTLGFPVVLKPALRTPAWLAEAGGKVLRLDSPDALRRAFRRLAPVACQGLVVQSWIPGGDDAMYSFYAFFDAAGRRQVALVARKIRQWPPGTGSGSLAVECDRPEVVAAGTRLLEASGHVGLAAVQLKQHAQTGRFLFVEANIGRVTMNMPIAEHCGVELLDTVVRASLGRSLPGARTVSRPGGRWISLKLDLPAGFVLWRRGELSLVDWARSLRGTHWHGTGSWRDPLPVVLDWLRKLPTGPRRLRRLARRR